MSNESRIERQLQAIIDEEPYSEPPGSRTEEILQSIIDDTEYDRPAESRIESKLLELKEVIASKSGGTPIGQAVGILGGTSKTFIGEAVAVTSIDVPPLPQE